MRDPSEPDTPLPDGALPDGALIRTCLPRVLKDQFPEDDPSVTSRGGWSTRYPRYLSRVYGDRLASDVRRGDSITYSRWIGRALLDLLRGKPHALGTDEKLEIRRALDLLPAYLRRHFLQSRGFGQPMPLNDDPGNLHVDVRHSAAAMHLLLDLELEEEPWDARLRDTAAFIYSELENGLAKLRERRKRGITAAPLHSLLTRQRARRYFPASRRSLRQITKQLENLLLETYSEREKTWDQDEEWDPYGWARIDNALIVLSTVDPNQVTDPDCAAALQEAAEHLLVERSVQFQGPLVRALPFEPAGSTVPTKGPRELEERYPRGGPDLGTTLQFLWAVHRTNLRAEQATSEGTPWLDPWRLRPLYQFVNEVLERKDRFPGPCYPWHLASGLRLAASGSWIGS